jgi:hypothetical protein
MPIEPVLSGES